MLASPGDAVCAGGTQILSQPSLRADENLSLLQSPYSESCPPNGYVCKPVVIQKWIFFKPLPSVPGGGWGQIPLRRRDRKRGGSLENKVGSLRKEREFDGQRA